jgi:predicted transcriptional regulator
VSEGRRHVCGHRLPGLEADVLELLLARQAPMTVAEVQQALAGTRRAPTTVSTLLTRLGERGLVTRRHRGRVYEWSPAGTAQELTIAALHQVLDGVENPDAVVLGNRPRRPPRAKG